MSTTSSIPDDAPPPYTPIDPLTPSSSNDSAAAVEEAEQAHVDNDNNNDDTEIPSYSSLVTAPNFISAAPYFRERPPPVLHQAQQQEEPSFKHTITIYSRSQAKDFSRFPKCLRRGHATEITQHDWDTFLNYLFPPHLAPAASQAHLPRKLRAEIERDRKDRAQEGDERRARISAVIAEWNKDFFLPRSTEILFTYVSSSDSPPSTHLCPRCYPSAVRSLPMRGGSSSSRSGISRSQTTPTFSSQQSTPRKPVGAHSRSNTALAPEVSTVTAQGSTSIPFTTDNLNATLADRSAYGYKFAPPFAITGATNTIVNWAAQIGERAEQYGQWISEQAAAHGKRVEECGQQYGRMIEEHARAKGEFIEQRAKYLQSIKAGRGAGRGRGWGDPRSHRAHHWDAFAHMHHHHSFGRGGPWGQDGKAALADNASGWEGHGRFSYGGRRQRSASVSSTSSSSSSSSSSSESDASFLSSLSTYSQRHAAGLIEFKERIRDIQSEHEQSQTRRRISVHRSDAAHLRRELRLLRTAHKQFRASKRGRREDGVHRFPPWAAARRSSNAAIASSSNQNFSDIKSEDAQRALKEEIQSTKKEFRALVGKIREEKKELRRSRRQRRREGRRLRMEERRERRERRNKGKVGNDD
ncbi:hypothetical protein AJ79_08457 [Helicocarpus griseus UAMH5409]|uniref:Uncharacterized protein n=1 Tax=Helicocarpus griseus UAMH5409 TaxID=1447875 RepID=A0A2B7WJY4_9EURO|nr:hypothetical protein AJ79_08457 [Helicocarpus griseus UAMH5409]